jgi:hypothetical protein
VFKLKRAFLLLCFFLPNIADAAHYTGLKDRTLEGYLLQLFFLLILLLFHFMNYLNNFFETRIENKKSEKEKEVTKPEVPLIRSIEEFKKQKKNKK